MVKYQDRRHCVRLVRYPDRDLPLQSRGKYRERKISFNPTRQVRCAKMAWETFISNYLQINLFGKFAACIAMLGWEREMDPWHLPWVYIIYNQGLQVKAMHCQHLRYCQLPIVFCVKLHLFSSSFPWIEFELLTPEFWEIVTIKMSFVSNPFAKKQVWVVWVFNVLYIEPIIIMWCYDEMQKLTSKDEFNPLIVIEKSF